MRYVLVLLLACLAAHGVEEKAAKDAAPLKKFPIPSVNAQKEQEKVVREVFKDDFEKTGAPEKLALARKMLVQAGESADDPAALYELAVLAGPLAAQSGSIDDVLKIGDLLAARFEGDTSFLLKTNLGLLAAGGGDPKVVKLAKAFKSLLDKPDDPAANLLAGKHLAFVAHDFGRGAALLAKCGVPALSQLAKQDAATTDQPPAQVATADAWWEAAEKASDKEEKRCFIERAGFWYEKALPGLTGLQKVKAERRIGAQTESAANSPKTAAAQPPGTPAPAPASKNEPAAEKTAAATAAGTDSDAIAELKKAGWTRITGIWKKTATATYETTDGMLEGGYLNGSIDVVLDRENTASVCIYGRCSPQYKLGYGLVIRGGKTKTQVLATEVTVNGNYRYIHNGEPLESFEQQIPSKERYLHAGVSVNGQTIELMFCDKRDHKNIYPKMAQDGPMRIRVHGTATLINPRCAETK